MVILTAQTVTFTASFNAAWYIYVCKNLLYLQGITALRLSFTKPNRLYTPTPVRDAMLL